MAENEAATRQQLSEYAQSKGWTRQQEYDYELYNAQNSEERDRILRSKQGNAQEAHENGAVLTSCLPAWAAGAVKYEWKDEYGEVGPRIPQLEKELFGDDFRPVKGSNVEAFEFKVSVESEQKVSRIAKFEDAGMHPVMLENIQMSKYTVPTPIQSYCIPAILQNRDIIAVAQTGSGKTAAFLIPVISKLMGKAKKLCGSRVPASAEFFNPMTMGVVAEPLVLIIVPTRELSAQIFDEARRLCYRSRLRPCVAYGGGPSREQADDLRRGCDILIGTPGRLIDFMNRGNLLSLRRVRYTILDEADELVSGDWTEEMKALMSGADNNEDADHRYMMFSATFPKAARALAKEYLDSGHIRIRVGRAGSTHMNIKQNIIYCESDLKNKCLLDLIMASPPARTIVFVNSKRMADLIDDFLYNNGLPSTSIHSDRTQREREDAIRAFRSATAPILVTTSVSARGLDIINVMHVINYDLPNSDHGGINDYVHRIGRTARIGQTGLATSLFNERNEDIAHDLAKLLVECNQHIPEFMQEYVPENKEELDFDDDSQDENDGADDNGGGWATGGVSNGDSAWGTAAASTSNGNAWEPASASQPASNADEWGSGPSAGKEAATKPVTKAEDLKEGHIAASWGDIKKQDFGRIDKIAADELTQWSDGEGDAGASW